MRALQRSLRLGVPPDAAFAACLALLGTADPRRAVVERRCDPDPPAVGGVVTSRLADGRELQSRMAELDAGARRVSTSAMGDGPSLRVTLAVDAESGGSLVTLTSEVTAGLTGRERSARLLDGLLFGRAQRRSARATLRRVRGFAAGLEAA